MKACGGPGGNVGGKEIGGRGAGSWRRRELVAGGCQGIGRTVAGGCQGIGKQEVLSKEERTSTNCILMMGRKRYVLC